MQKNMSSMATDISLHLRADMRMHIRVDMQTCLLMNSYPCGSIYVEVCIVAIGIKIFHGHVDIPSVGV